VSFFACGCSQENIFVHKDHLFQINKSISAIAAPEKSVGYGG
jgi:hypothetical protein